MIAKWRATTYIPKIRWADNKLTYLPLDIAKTLQDYYPQLYSLPRRTPEQGSKTKDATVMTYLDRH
ncbi:Hypothetical predicted protein, partial [Pelobates cultripes]